ncbi:CsiV family protein [Thalassotalea litorea]|uniref:CsiV family protein n=1 Tax=Thalassotalea litorea TaxID=2020715 RepID=UPI00373706D7
MTRLSKTKKAHHFYQSLIASTALSLSAAGLMWPTISNAQIEEEQPRWFEIEVILVQQLQNQYLSNEQFDTGILTPYQGKSLELIEPYLTELKNFQHALPECESSKVDMARASDKAYLDAAVAGHTLSQEETQDITIELGCKPAQPPQLFDELTQGDITELAYIPKYFSGYENPQAEQPYLLAQGSLQLGHIYRSLARSQHFRPLLHLGWRQPVLAQGDALPVKLMAGENINFQYPEQAQTLNEILLEQQVELPQSGLRDEEQIQANLQRIIEQLQASGDEIDVAPILATLQQQQQLLSQQQQAQQLSQLIARPNQDWFIEGFFKVHLDHYLFINSEFNVYRPLNEETIEAVQKNQTASVDNIVTSIPFKQNRRVISGELHYFDHPFMGMIVQIRRHERPQPEDDMAIATEQSQANE